MILDHFPPDNRGRNHLSYVCTVTDLSTGRTGRVRINPGDPWYNLTSMVDSSSIKDIKTDDTWAFIQLDEFLEAWKAQ